MITIIFFTNTLVYYIQQFFFTILTSNYGKIKAFFLNDECRHLIACIRCTFGNKINKTLKNVFLFEFVCATQNIALSGNIF